MAISVSLITYREAQKGGLVSPQWKTLYTQGDLWIFEHKKLPNMNLVDICVYTSGKSIRIQGVLNLNKPNF